MDSYQSQQFPPTEGLAYPPSIPVVQLQELHYATHLNSLTPAYNESSQDLIFLQEQLNFLKGYEEVVSSFTKHIKKHMVKFSNSKIYTYPIGQMKDIWGFLMGEINITMNAYTEFSTNVKTIVAKLTTLLEIRNKTRLKIVAEGNLADENMRIWHQNIERLRGIYYMRGRNYDTEYAHCLKQKSSSKTSLKEITKLEEKLDRSKRWLDESCDTYMQAIDQANTYQRHHYQNIIPSILRDFEFFKEEGLETYINIAKVYSEALQTIPARLNEQRNPLNCAVSTFNSKKNIQDWISVNKQMDIVHPFAFLPYNAPEALNTPLPRGLTNKDLNSEIKKAVLPDVDFKIKRPDLDIDIDFKKLKRPDIDIDLGKKPDIDIDFKLPKLIPSIDIDRKRSSTKHGHTGAPDIDIDLGHKKKVDMDIDLDVRRPKMPDFDVDMKQPNIPGVNHKKDKKHKKYGRSHHDVDLSRHQQNFAGQYNSSPNLLAPGAGGQGYVPPNNNFARDIDVTNGIPPVSQGIYSSTNQYPSSNILPQSAPLYPGNQPPPPSQLNSAYSSQQILPSSYPQQQQQQQPGGSGGSPYNSQNFQPPNQLNNGQPIQQSGGSPYDSQNFQLPNQQQHYNSQNIQLPNQMNKDQPGGQPIQQQQHSGGSPYNSQNFQPNQLNNGQPIQQQSSPYASQQNYQPIPLSDHLSQQFPQSNQYANSHLPGAHQQQQQQQQPGVHPNAHQQSGGSPYNSQNFQPPNQLNNGQPIQQSASPYASQQNYQQIPTSDQSNAHHSQQSYQQPQPSDQLNANNSHQSPQSNQYAFSHLPIAQQQQHSGGPPNVQQQSASSYNSPQSSSYNSQPYPQSNQVSQLQPQSQLQSQEKPQENIIQNNNANLPQENSPIEKKEENDKKRPVAKKGLVRPGPKKVVAKKKPANSNDETIRVPPNQAYSHVSIRKKGLSKTVDLGDLDQS